MPRGTSAARLLLSAHCCEVGSVRGTADYPIFWLEQGWSVVGIHSNALARIHVFTSNVSEQVYSELPGGLGATLGFPHHGSCQRKCNAAWPLYP